MREYQRKHNRTQERIKYATNHWELGLFNSARKSARARNLEFNLKLSDIVIPLQCPYLKVSLTRIRG